MKKAPVALVLAAVMLVACGEEADEPAGAPAVESPARAASPAPNLTAVRTEDINAALAAAESYLASGQTMEAEAIIAVLVDKTPDHPRAREMYGRVLLSQAIALADLGESEAAGRQFLAAYEQYDAAASLEPDSAGLHQNAAEIAHSVGLLEEALAHYRAAGRLAPLDVRPPLYEAQVLIAQNRLDEARTALDRVLALDPAEPVAHGSLAMVALERGDYPAALAFISTARQISPDDLRFRAQEAKIYRRMGDPRRGLELLVNLSPAERADAAVTFEIATSYGLLGEHEKSAEAWEHRWSSFPGASDSAAIAARAGLARLKANQPEKAWVWLEEAKLLDPRGSETEVLERTLAERRDDGRDPPG